MPKQAGIHYMGDGDLRLSGGTGEDSSGELDPSVQEVLEDTKFNLADYIDHQFDNVNKGVSK